jgi:transposase-like protein
MDRVGFDLWLASVGQLTAGQRSDAFLALALAEAGAEEWRVAAVPQDVVEDATVSNVLPLAVAAQARIERAGCPHCASHKLGRWGHASGLPRYRCGECRRTFNALSGTPLARLRKKDRWADQAEALKSGESVAKAAARCGVAVTTAFRWRHRFLSAPALDKPAQLTGIVEADETYILESFKGKRAGLSRPAHKRGGMAKTRGLSAEQIPVLIARDRTGATTDAVLAKRDRASIATALGGVVTPANQLCCDGGKAIVSFARKAKIPCCILPKPGGPRPEAPNLHINNVNGYHGRLKEWLRPFHGVATAYLDHYLGWRRTVEAISTAAGHQDWLGAALGERVYQ